MKDTDLWKKITGYTQNGYTSTQSVLAKRLYGNDKHATKIDKVRAYEMIRGKSPQTFRSLQEGLFTTMCVDNAWVTGAYATKYSEEEWLQAAISNNSDIFGSFRTSFENDLNSTVTTSTATFTRAACTATQLDSAGKIQYTAAANSPRFQAGKYDTGVWIERAKSNVLLYGNTDLFTTSVSGTMNSGWSYYQSGGTVNATGTYNSANVGQPFGTTCQMIATPLTATATYWGMSKSNVAFANNSPYTLSYYAKCSNGTANISPLIAAAGIDTAIAIDTTWRRYSVTGTTTNITGFVYIRVPGNGVTAYLNALQLEQAPYASTYIPTTTVSATRNTENLTYNVPSQCNETYGTISCWAKPEWPVLDSLAHNVFQAVTSDNSISIDLEKNAANAYIFTVVGTTGDTKTVLFTGMSATTTQNSWTHFAATWNNGTHAIYLNGVSVGVSGGTGGSGIGKSITGGTIRVGSRIGDAARGSDSLIDSFAIYDRALTAGEIWNQYTKGI